MYNNKKRKFIILNFALVLFFNAAFAQKKPTHFKSDIDFGNGTVFSTFMDATISKGQFTLTSPKNADVRIFGGKAKLGRMMGKSPKKGIIVTIHGQQKNDSLFGDSNIPMVGKLKFRGIIKNERLSGEFLNTDGIAIGTLKGVTSAEDKMDYKPLYPLLMQTVRDNIYSKSALENKEWKTFEKEMEELCAKAHDDIELYFGFNILSKNLPFSHLTLTIAQQTTDNSETAEEEASPNTSKSVIFEEKNPTTAYLKIKNFSNSTAELEAALPKIVAQTAYKNLIVDLRDNGGGGISAAFAFAKYIVTDDLEVGYFPTNKLHYSGYQPKLFETLPAMQPKDTNKFGEELKKSPGAKLVFKKPTNPGFTGTLYILTNGRTASTCEPIVYALKKNKKANIVGEKTAGAMLSASPFTVQGKYMLVLPVADFYTYDGVRLDKVGVDPDIAVPSEQALTTALDLIDGKKG